MVQPLTSSPIADPSQLPHMVLVFFVFLPHPYHTLTFMISKCEAQKNILLDGKRNKTHMENCDQGYGKISRVLRITMWI